MKTVELYTDGACSGNPGPGGYGIVLIYQNTVKEFSGFEPQTTNNQMELKAVIEGLKKIKEKCNVNIYTDSAYVCNAFTQNWITNWIANGWKNANKKPVLNKEMWQELIDLTNKHNVAFHKVKGHSDNYYNNICDKLATDAIKNNAV